MKIISLNIGKSTTIHWNGKQEQTGIYKKPVAIPLTLGLEDVTHDTVIDRVHHGGIDKAVYMYGANHYSFWKNNYPDADYTFGAFGENITLEEIDEHQIFIGDNYKLGTAKIQVSSSRIPCYKLGIRLGNPMVVKTFAEQSFSGVYFRVLESGIVSKGDSLILTEKASEKLSIADLHSLFSDQKNNLTLAKTAINHPNLAKSFKKSIQKQINHQLRKGNSL